MNSDPLVSILIPTFNQREDFLRECLDSALCQTFSTLEVVVSNNHSTNGLLDVLSSYADPRLRIVSPPSFVPMNENFAYCAEQARGDYISFLSSDDKLAPEAIEVLVSEIRKAPSCVFAAGNIRYGRSDVVVNGKDTARTLRPASKSVRRMSADEVRDVLYPWSLSSTWMAGNVIDRKAYEATGGFRCCSLYSAGDVWLTGELLKQGGMVMIGWPLAFFRARGAVVSEVDRDRRLNDLIDEVLQQASGVTMRRALGKLFQIIKVVYRVGARPAPGLAAVRAAADEFARAGRDDLVRTLRFVERFPVISRAMSLALRWIDVVRRALW